MKTTQQTTIEIDRAGMCRIVAESISRSQSVSASADDVAFRVGTSSTGFGMNESNVTTMHGASVSVAASKQSQGILKVTGTSQVDLDADEVKSAIAAYVARECGCDAAAATVSFFLRDQRQGDHGYEAADVEKAFVRLAA